MGQKYIYRVQIIHYSCSLEDFKRLIQQSQFRGRSTYALYMYTGLGIIRLFVIFRGVAFKNRHGGCASSHPPPLYSRLDTMTGSSNNIICAPPPEEETEKMITKVLSDFRLLVNAVQDFISS